MDPRGLCLVLRLSLCGDSAAVVLEAAVLLFLLLLLLQDISYCVQQVVEEFMGVLLHVVVEQIWKKIHRYRKEGSLKEGLPVL